MVQRMIDSLAWWEFCEYSGLGFTGAWDSQAIRVSSRGYLAMLWRVAYQHAVFQAWWAEAVMTYGLITGQYPFMPPSSVRAETAASLDQPPQSYKSAHHWSNSPQSLGTQSKQCISVWQIVHWQRSGIPGGLDTGLLPTGVSLWLQGFPAAFAGHCRILLRPQKLPWNQWCVPWVSRVISDKQHVAPTRPDAKLLRFQLSLSPTHTGMAVRMLFLDPSSSFLNAFCLYPQQFQDFKELSNLVLFFFQFDKKLTTHTIWQHTH